MVVVKTLLVTDIAVDKQTGRNTRGKTQDIDEGKTLMTQQVTPGDPKIIGRSNDHSPRNAKTPLKGSLARGV
jgi:hypothetical protein